MLDQEQGTQEALLESEMREEDPLGGFTIDDVKSALERVTDEVLISMQVLSEKGQWYPPHPHPTPRYNWPIRQQL